MNRSLFLLLLTLYIFFSGCGKSTNVYKNSSEHVPDTLHAATLYGPASYFIFRNQPMGFEYENLKRFSDDQGFILDLKIAPSFSKMLEWIKNGEIDLIAYPIPIINEYKDFINFAGPKEISYQVLIQKNNAEKVKDVTELIGKEIYVENNSRNFYRLLNLNEELGGGIIITPFDKDSIFDEELIEMVDQNKIQYAILGSDIAAINKPYYRDLDMDLKVSLEQFSSWGVAKDAAGLLDKINDWDNHKENNQLISSIYKKYFENSKDSIEWANPQDDLDKLIKGTTLSPFDDIFKKYAKISGWDWRLIAAVAFIESKFKPDVISRFGAAGLMQVMPATASAMGVNPSSLINNPDENVKAATKLLVQLDKSLKPYVAEDEERLKFVLAAYNAGIGHVFDAIGLAKKYNLDPSKWQGNVSESIILKANPHYFNDPAVKFGFLRGRETIDFVNNVEYVYNYFKNKTS